MADHVWGLRRLMEAIDWTACTRTTGIRIAKGRNFAEIRKAVGKASLRS